MISVLLILITAIAIFAAAYGIGTWRHSREVKARQGKPICGCEHHRAMHDPATNECHGRNYEGGGIYSRCTCRQYVGPEPLPSYYAPEIEPGERP
jgi:hypothetical protein